VWSHFLIFLPLLREAERGQFAVKKRKKKGKNRQKEGIGDEMGFTLTDTKRILK